MHKFIFEVLDLVFSFIEPKEHLRDWIMFWLIVMAGIFSVYFIGINNFNYLLKGAVQVVAVLLPFVLPIALWLVLLRYYRRYIVASFIKKESSVLLEIKVPKETVKSPLAMEIFLTALYQTGSANLVEAFWLGKVRPWFSLEMVSLGGEVKFFIWSLKKWKNLIEAQLYAQYPDIEIHEAEDYTKDVHHDPDGLPFWATYFKLEKKDVYPIKTYVDYGLDKPDLKEEYKIDPITSVLEYLGSMKKGEQAWIQILIQAHRKEKSIDFRFLHLKEDWKKEIDEEIESIKESSMVEEEVGEGTVRRVARPTPGQIDTIKALERSKDKFPFEVGIRGFYIAEKKVFNPIGITGLIGSFRQYNSNNSNGFKLGWYTDLDLPWRDYKRQRRNFMEQEFLEAYKLRSFFQYPFKNFESKPFILMTEELATIFHFPGGVSKTPTLERIMSKRAEPPPNLPR